MNMKLLFKNIKFLYIYSETSLYSGCGALAGMLGVIQSSRYKCSHMLKLLHRLDTSARRFGNSFRSINEI